MKYLIIDKKQRVQVEGMGADTYAITRLKEELDKIGAICTIASFEDIEVNQLGNQMSIRVSGEDLTSFTHILLRGHSLHRPVEYELKRILAHYIDQHNKNNPQNQIKFQNIESFKTIEHYDKLYIQKMCIDNDLPIIPTIYRSNGIYIPAPFPYPYILKDFTGENDIRLIDGKEKVKKNVYLIEKEEDLKQENLLNKNLTQYFAQQFITTGEDFRIFVSKGVALGGFSRKATEGFMTVKQGEYVSVNKETSPEIFELAQKTAQIFKADFIAVDLMTNEESKAVILEISLNPGFKAYETKTSGEVVNIAEVIINSF